jgi:MFS family permease
MGLAASMVFYALFGVASEIAAAGWPAVGLALLFVARLGAGVAGATISTAQAVIADSTTAENRSGGMALIGAAFGIGFTFGPLLGFAALFSPWKGAPGYAAASLSLVALVLAWLLLPETRRPDSTPQTRRWLDWSGMQDALRTPTVGVLVLTFFLATFAFGSLESTLALVNRLLLDPPSELRELRPELTVIEARDTAQKSFLIFAYVGLVLMLAQGLLYRRLVKRIGEVPFMRIGIVLMAGGLAGAVLILLARHPVETPPGLLLAALATMTLAVLGFACLTPSVQALISRRSDPNKQGEVLGVNQAGAALARILGPLVGVTLFHLKPYIWPFVFGAVLLLGLFVLALRIEAE